MKKIICLFILAVLMNGCGNKPAQNLKNQPVKFLWVGKDLTPSGCKYIGKISVNKSLNNEASIDEDLKKKATALGGNTIIIPIRGGKKACCSDYDSLKVVKCIPGEGAALGNFGQSCCQKF